MHGPWALLSASTSSVHRKSCVQVAAPSNLLKIQKPSDNPLGPGDALALGFQYKNKRSTCTDVPRTGQTFVQINISNVG